MGKVYFSGTTSNTGGWTTSPIAETTTATIHADKITSSNGTNVQDELKQIWDRLNKTVSLVHNCANCGARLEVEENKPVIHCKYCGSTYLVGSVQLNSHY